MTGRLSDSQNDLIRRAKREVWQQQGAGEEYLHFVYDSEPRTRLKNLVEISYVLSQVRGPRVLDAGAGTGRFTIPLRQQGVRVVPLDISASMLAQGVQMARTKDVGFPACVGDVERLPFADATFDSVVSITVVRHFPLWRPILAEYLRVLKHGGRLIFDMGSGDQCAYLRATTDRVEEKTVAPLDYDGAMSFAELEQFACDNGLCVADFRPHDFLNNNALLERALGPRKEALFKRTAPLLSSPDGAQLFEWAARLLLPGLGPALCPSWLAVLEKDKTDGTFAPPFRARKPVGALSWEEAARRAAGDEWPTLVGVVQSGRARRLVRVLTEEVLPRLPLDAVCWEAPGQKRWTPAQSND